MLDILSNISSMTATRYLSKNTAALNQSLERMASGMRINKSSDDSAGLQISETLRSKYRATDVAQDNVETGINIMNIMDDAMGSMVEGLQRMRELAVEASNSGLSSAERTAIQDEIDLLAGDITQLSDGAQYNELHLLNGSMGNFYIQTGTDGVNTDRLDLTTAGASNPFGDLDATAIGVNNTDVSDEDNAQTTVETIDTAISTLNTRRSNVGALSRRLQSVADNLAVTSENYRAAEARVRNTDVAQESARMVQYQILQQSSAMVLSQSNQMPSLALRLLGG